LPVPVPPTSTALRCWAMKPPPVIPLAGGLFLCLIPAPQNKTRGGEHLPLRSLSSFLTKENYMATEGSAGPLIASDKVSGTAVYGPDKERMGSIERVMIDKTSGQVAYAVLSFGGFLGIGDDHYPVPWNTLRYDTDLGGYRTLISGNRLKGAPEARH
jgi:hypothetical protein